MQEATLMDQTTRLQVSNKLVIEIPDTSQIGKAMFYYGRDPSHPPARVLYSVLLHPFGRIIEQAYKTKMPGRKVVDEFEEY
jgi:hypothetical protein